MKIRTQGIDHIHFNVPDLRKAIALLQELFESEATPIGHLAPHGMYNATVKLAGGEGARAYLDVFQPEREDSEVAQFMRERGPSVSYVSFRVGDLEAAAAHASNCGLREVSRVGYGGMKQVQYDTMAVLGFHLEFVEYAPGFWEGLEGIKARLRAGETVDGLSYVKD